MSVCTSCSTQCMTLYACIKTELGTLQNLPRAILFLGFLQYQRNSLMVVSTSSGAHVAAYSLTHCVHVIIILPLCCKSLSFHTSKDLNVTFSKMLCWEKKKRNNVLMFILIHLMRWGHCPSVKCKRRRCQ